MQVKSYISSKIFIALMDYGHPEVFYFFIIYHLFTYISLSLSTLTLKELYFVISNDRNPTFKERNEQFYRD